MVYGRRPPNWIFEGIVFEPFHILGERATYLPIIFRKNILIGVEICPKTKFKTGSPAVEFYFRFFILTMSSFGNLPMYHHRKISKKSKCLTSHLTLYRSFLGRFLQARWPNQQRQSTERSQLATEINPTRTTPPCYSINCRQPPLG